ncbi:TIGR04282 family arsenosugar biosynthesis glycosyltransferase [Kaarinaea lacus]
MIFCKAPEPGKVMTRLAEALNDLELDGYRIAARIHGFLARERLRHATSDDLAPVELWCAPDRNHSFFKECEKDYPVVLKEQIQGNLGERMLHAFDDALSAGFSAILIGTDCPSLDVSVMSQALNYLDEDNCSVIGPAEDGGYILIGLTTRQTAIFRDMEWSNSQVCEKTLLRIQGVVKQLPELWDVDRLEDLYRLAEQSRELELSQEFIDYLDSLELPARRV